jgi:hypothetical protein
MPILWSTLRLCQPSRPSHTLNITEPTSVRHPSLRRRNGLIIHRAGQGRGWGRRVRRGIQGLGKVGFGQDKKCASTDNIDIAWCSRSVASLPQPVNPLVRLDVRNTDSNLTCIAASAHLTDDSLSLPKLISTSQTTKARLLHYFPPAPDAPVLENEPIDSWCGFHKDHSLITGLCSALYLRDGTDAVPPPSPAAGLYIKTRSGELAQVKIPVDCLAFQTGEALELATAGKLRATPHCVRAGGGGSAGERVSRETFGELIDRDTH